MHLTLPQRRNLHTKVATHLAFGPPRGVPSYDAVRKRAFELVDHEANATLSSGEPIRLDAFADRISSYTEETLLKTPSLEICEDGRVAIEEMKKNARKPQCEECANNTHSLVCDGSSDDDLTVARGGQCMAAVRKLIVGAMSATQAYYEAYSPEFRALAKKPMLSWSERYYPAVAGRTKPHGIPVPVYIGGETQFLDRDDMTAAEIIIKFALERMDYNSLEALPYVVMHECMCHGFQGAASIWGNRSSPMGFDMFSEGWIDCLITDVFRNMRAGKGPALVEAQSIATEGQIVAGLDMQSARSNPAREDAPSFASYAARSNAVAHRIRNELCKRLGDEEGCAAFLRLSFDLNLLLGGLPYRNELVNKLTVALAPSDAHYAALQKSLDAVAANGQTRKFIAEILH